MIVSLLSHLICPPFNKIFSGFQLVMCIALAGPVVGSSLQSDYIFDYYLVENDSIEEGDLTAADTSYLPYTPLKINRLALVNAETGQPIPEYTSITDSAIIDLSRLSARAIGLVAYTSGSTSGSVQFILNLAVNTVETVKPYSNNDNFHLLTPTPGWYSLTAIPYNKENKGGERGEILNIAFEVVSNTLSPIAVNFAATPDVPAIPDPTPIAPSPLSPITDFVFEAEQMMLDNFQIIEIPYASNQHMIEIGSGKPANATAQAYFHAPSARYQIEIAYLDESDGQGTLRVAIDSDTLDSWILDEDRPTVGYNERGYVEKTITKEVLVNSGSIISIEGIKDQGERIVLDYIKFTQLRDDISIKEPNVFPSGPPTEPTVFAKKKDDSGKKKIATAEDNTSLTEGKIFNTAIAINLFPNPVANQLHIAGTSRGTFLMYDLQGKTIKTGELSAGQTTLSVSDVPAGIYQLRVLDETRAITRKIIVKH